MKKGLYKIEFVNEKGENGVRIYFKGKSTGKHITQFFTIKEIIKALK
ncbi:hypothetical protein LCGC14_1129270 [marine sediment metagenome]|uniref:Uncharacterized protein n=1 Tax=marine sediment metagenome TaxID=412755 RepID=A0A0F9M6C3_9ZZZZ